MNEKNIKIGIQLVLCLMFMAIIIYIFIIKRGPDYKISQGECKSGVIMDDSNRLNENKECLVPGYYIDNNEVNINIGTINCANDIEIVKLKVDKKMNVYIMVKEKVSELQENCLCSPSLNVKFNEKIRSVTLVTEDGTKLEECK